MWPPRVSRALRRMWPWSLRLGLARSLEQDLAQEVGLRVAGPLALASPQTQAFAKV
jgi:hypothetical protein